MSKLKICLLLVGSLIACRAFSAGDLPNLSTPTPKIRAELTSILPQSPAPQAQLIERAETAVPQVKHAHHAQTERFKTSLRERLRQLFQTPRAMKRAKRAQKNFWAGLIGFFGLCAGLIGNWYGFLLLFAPPITVLF